MKAEGLMKSTIEIITLDNSILDKRKNNWQACVTYSACCVSFSLPLVDMNEDHA